MIGPVYRTCSYARPGTYGHECGAPATHVRVSSGWHHDGDRIPKSYRCLAHQHAIEPGEPTLQTTLAQYDSAVPLQITLWYDSAALWSGE